MPTSLREDYQKINIYSCMMLQIFSVGVLKLMRQSSIKFVILEALSNMTQFYDGKQSKVCT